jgi:hypothetical protein
VGGSQPLILDTSTTSEMEFSIVPLFFSMMNE